MEKTVQRKRPFEASLCDEEDDAGSPSVDEVEDVPSLPVKKARHELVQEEARRPAKALGSTKVKGSTFKPLSHQLGRPVVSQAVGSTSHPEAQVGSASLTSASGPKVFGGRHGRALSKIFQMIREEQPEEVR